VKALRYHLKKAGAYALEIDDLPDPKPSKGEVLVRVAFCGICGSDLARYRQSLNPTRELRELLGEISSVPGHEISGVVDALGPAVPHEWSDHVPVIGTPVAINPLIGCGVCSACRAGSWNQCTSGQLKLIGLQRNGGFAEAVTVPFDHLIRISPEANLPLEIAAMAEPLAVALHAVERAGISDRPMRITVIGDGSLGLLICHVLERLGCREVRIIGRHRSRLALASKLGAQTVRPSGDVNPAEKSELVFQTAGSLAALKAGLQSLSTNGHMVCLGYVDSAEREMDPAVFNGMIRENQRLSGSFGYRRDSFLQACEGLIAGRFQIAALVARTVSLANARAEGFDAFVRGTRWAGKLLVSP
jgi:(R,R)-butanediol dehydrogenase / meso-butanediol dehydrogenase / diacetyl reductase